MHFYCRHRRFVAFITQFSSGPILCLLHGIGRQHPEDEGYPEQCIEVCNTLCDTLTNIVEMRRISPHDTADGNHGIGLVMNVTISNLIISGQRYDNFISVPTFSYEYHILFVPLHALG